jgi:hypothetical protein
MSDFRRQLESLKREHDAARYPGNLAKDVLPSAGRINPFVLGAWVAGAIAAMVTVVIVVQRPNSKFASGGSISIRPSSRPAEESQTATTEPAEVQVDMADVTALVAPEGIDLSPSKPTDASMPSMPSFPSMEAMIEQSQQSTATTQEAA